MQVRAGSTAHTGELPVHASSGGTVTTPYAIIAFSSAFDVSLQSGEDCDRVIRAAVRAKAMLEKIGTPHEFTPMAGNNGHCDVCGDLNDEDHWRPEATAVRGLQDPAPVVRVLDASGTALAAVARAVTKDERETADPGYLEDAAAQGDDPAADPFLAGRCARPGCLHKRDHHEQPDSDDGQPGGCALAWCSCTDYR